jgi:hypothetical protein
VLHYSASSIDAWTFSISRRRRIHSFSTAHYPGTSIDRLEMILVSRTSPLLTSKRQQLDAHTILKIYRISAMANIRDPARILLVFIAMLPYSSINRAGLPSKTPQIKMFQQSQSSLRNATRTHAFGTSPRNVRQHRRASLHERVIPSAARFTRLQWASEEGATTTSLVPKTPLPPRSSCDDTTADDSISGCRTACGKIEV